VKIHVKMMASDKTNTDHGNTGTPLRY